MIEDTVRAFMAIVQKTMEDCALIRQRCELLGQRLEQINGAQRIRNLRAAMASEPDLLKPWPQRTRKRIVLPTGELAEPAQGRTLCTTYLRSAYTAGDIALLQKIVAAQPAFTYEQVMARKDALKRRKP